MAASNASDGAYPLRNLLPRRRVRRVIARLVALLWLVAAACTAAELSGRVVGVLDGDTIDVLTPAKEQVRVRLSGIDAPEKRQAFGNASKSALSGLVFNRQVIIQWSKKDRYRRTVGKVLNEGTDINLEMVKQGMAWHYKQYAHEQSRSDREHYSAAESLVRAQHIGLWRDANPIPPWHFRHSSAKVRSVASSYVIGVQRVPELSPSL